MADGGSVGGEGAVLKGPRRAPPMSPHLEIWRWHVTMAVSILHRASLMALYVGALILVGWLASLASGPEALDRFNGLLGSPLGLLVLFGLVFALFFQVTSVIRHAVWDMGAMCLPAQANTLSWASIGFSVAATVGIFIAALLTGAF